MSDRIPVPGGVRAYHVDVLSSVMGRMQLGIVFSLTPQELTALGDLSGCLNAAKAAALDLPVDVLPEVTPMDPQVVFTAQPDRIVAIPFRITTGPLGGSPDGYASSAEFQAGTALRKAALSQSPGDLTGVVRGQGAQVTLDFSVGVGPFLPGSLWFYNCVIAEGGPPTRSRLFIAFPH